ncbi:MAG: PHA/PHB synthase family protein [Rhodopila sp.]
MPFDQTSLAPVTQGAETLTPFAAYDQAVHGAVAEMTGGRSPVAVMEAWLDWASHLAISPGKQIDLCLRAAAAGAQLATPQAPADATSGLSSTWFYDWLTKAHTASRAWWHDATTGVRGVSERHEQVLDARIGEMFQAASPANSLLTNPALQRATLERGGMNLVEGVKNFATDHIGPKPPISDTYVVGKTMAITPGKVIFRNRLIELIQYEPTTPTVHPEPVLIVPAWIMKYYILDLRPQNSMIRFLVEQGHTVFAISWLNPTAEDQDMSMDDYRRDGVMAAIDTISHRLPDRKIHAAGYCLGGTMLSIAAATMARDGDDRLASMTLFTAQTDFTEPGELKLFISDTELTWLDSLMAQRGGLGGEQMGGAFQLLHADDLIWKPFVRRYVLGEADRPNDLMAWNADQTRMPRRMHSEYLRTMFLRNDLAGGRFKVGGRPIAIRDIRVPIFALGTAKDHVAPWRSAYKISLLARSDITFVLASGGHNAGVVSEPGHKGRSYRVLTLRASDSYIDPDTYLERAAAHEGSWWPEWQRWLAERSDDRVPAPAMPEALCDAPGTYVLQT